MAHELEIIDGEAQMFYAGETPWHGMGRSVDKALNAADAIVAGGLDWEVNKGPLFKQREGKFIEIPDRFEIVRDLDNKTLGIVGPDYKIVQNREAFQFFDSIVDDGDAKYETAGSLFGGKRIWLTARIGEGILIGGEDAHELYLLLTTSHDGSRALTAAVTMIRAVCNNTVTMGLRSAKTTWSMTHKQDLAGKLAEARDTLQLTFAYRDEFAKGAEKLMHIAVTPDKFREILVNTLPEQKRQKALNVERIMTVFESHPTIVDTSAKGNGWGAYNAVTFWLDHGREVRSTEARMTGLINGWGAKIREKTKNEILALV